MINKILLALVFIFLALSIPRWFLGEDQSILFTLSQVVAEWLALMLMLINGTFISKPYMKAMYVLIGILVLGAIFKIMHLTGADEMLMIALVLIPLLYTIHFFLKKKKTLLDILKELLVLVHFTVSGATMLHLTPPEIQWELTQVSNLIFWGTFFYFVISGIKDKTLLAS